MRAIVKGQAPPSLTKHRQTPHCDYDNYPNKDALRRALATEQQELCCYCMGRIQPDAGAMKIEHWRSQTRYPNAQLDYHNILGACMGGEGQPSRLQHCDTRKGNADLLWNPANRTHAIETQVRYGSDGTIKSNNGTFNTQLNQILNLNLAFLKNNRKGVLDSLLHWWCAQSKPVPRGRIKRQRDKHAYRNGTYCQVAVWWLDQKLRGSPR